MIECGFIGMAFNKFLHFPDLWVKFLKNSFIGELF